MKKLVDVAADITSVLLSVCQLISSEVARQESAPKDDNWMTCVEAADFRPR